MSFLKKMFAPEVDTAQLEKIRELEAKVEALDKSQAVIEFNMDGTIITANDNFLGAMGYRLDEIQGSHHRLFVEPALAESAEYRHFWDALNRGQFQQAEYLRIGKNGREVWIQASYNPIVDKEGKPYKVVKYATDITAQKMQAKENEYNSNIANALKVCQAGVMLADNDLNIVYLNDEVTTMLRYREEALKKGLPNSELTPCSAVMWMFSIKIRPISVACWGI